MENDVAIRKLSLVHGGLIPVILPVATVVLIPKWDEAANGFHPVEITLADGIFPPVFFSALSSMGCPEAASRLCSALRRFLNAAKPPNETPCVPWCDR